MAICWCCRKFLWTAIRWRFKMWSFIWEISWDGALLQSELKIHFILWTRYQAIIQSLLDQSVFNLYVKKVLSTILSQEWSPRSTTLWLEGPIHPTNAAMYGVPTSMYEPYKQCSGWQVQSARSNSHTLGWYWVDDIPSLGTMLALATGSTNFDGIAGSVGVVAELCNCVHACVY